MMNVNMYKSEYDECIEDATGLLQKEYKYVCLCKYNQYRYIYLYMHM